LPAGHNVHVSEEVAASVAEYLPATKRIPYPAVSPPSPDQGILSTLTVCYDYQYQASYASNACIAEVEDEGGRRQPPSAHLRGSCCTRSPSPSRAAGPRRRLRKV